MFLPQKFETMPSLKKQFVFKVQTFRKDFEIFRDFNVNITTIRNNGKSLKML